MTTTTSTRVDEPTAVAVQVPTLGWALKRALLAVVLLGAFIGMAAWLFYASIEPEAESNGAGGAVPAASIGRT